MKEVHLGEVLAQGSWTSFPDFSSGATDFRFVFGTDKDRERFLSVFLHCTVILPGGKSILLDTYLKWEKPGEWGLHMSATPREVYKGGEFTESSFKWIIPNLKSAILEVIGNGHSAYIIHYFLTKKYSQYAILTEAEVQWVLDLMIAEGSIEKPPKGFYKRAGGPEVKEYISY